MIQLMQLDTAEAKAIGGLIFDTDSLMSSEKDYSVPPIMSEASPTTSEEMKQYCYNQQGDTSVFTYTTLYSHFFEQNCGVLGAIVPTYYVFSGLWLALAVLFTAHLYLCIPPESRLSLQKSLLLLPALKSLEVVLQGVWLDYCPWVGMDNNSYQYL